jgi:hypothetical protein
LYVSTAMSRASEPTQDKTFGKTIAAAYQTTGAAIELGQGVRDDQLVHEAAVKVPQDDEPARVDRRRHDVEAVAKASPLYSKYGTRTDPQSAREMLADRIARATTPEAPPAKAPDREQAARAPQGGTDTLGDFLNSRAGKQVQREVIRGVFGLLKKRL